MVKKRNGDLVEFDGGKIAAAISGAFLAKGSVAVERSEAVAQKVVERLEKNGYGKDSTPSVENIQDTVEIILLEEGYTEVARKYILYRQTRREIRRSKLNVIGGTVLDAVSREFDVNSLRVLASRYLLRDDDGELKESPTELFTRVGTLIGMGDILYDDEVFAHDAEAPGIADALEYRHKIDKFDNTLSIGKYHINKWHFEALLRNYMALNTAGNMKISFRHLLTKIAAHEFDKYEDTITSYIRLMTSREFLPNTPTLMNAGARLGQLSACFVLGMDDDMASIMDTTKDAAMIFQSGGGVGINYSNLRHEGDLVASTSGVASGPVSFMNIINTVTDVVKQGGKRRGANMGILEVWHPDIEKFVEAKTKPGVLENFNVSVGLWDDFWEAYGSDADHMYNLRSPRTNDEVGSVDARRLIDKIAQSAWKSAEPGLIFFDNINKHNVMTKARGGPLRATNPCGEQSLYPNESCNLGSINIAQYVTRSADGSYSFDWKAYEQCIRDTTRFLDNVVGLNKYPIREISSASNETRRIGLGVMGVADLLYKLRVPYNSKDGFEWQSRLAEALTYVSMDESVELAKERGSFTMYHMTGYADGDLPVAGYYDRSNKTSKYDWNALIQKIRKHGIRNVYTTTVAPTGTLSMLANCSNGMEPVFALVFEKRVTVGKFLYTNEIFKEALEAEGLYNDEILKKIANNYGSLRGLDEIPQHMQDVFVTAMDLHWADHLMAQAVWQEWINNAIAKTINMPHDSTIDDVKDAYLLAHRLGLKGITVYRDGSRRTQVLHMTDKDARKTFVVRPGDYVTSYMNRNDFKISGKVRPILPAAQPDTTRSEDDSENACPHCEAELIFAEGCSTCVDCGFSACSSV